MRSWVLLSVCAAVGGSDAFAPLPPLGGLFKVDPKNMFHVMTGGEQTQEQELAKLVHPQNWVPPKSWVAPRPRQRPAYMNAIFGRQDGSVADKLADARTIYNEASKPVAPGETSAKKVHISEGPIARAFARAKAYYKNEPSTPLAVGDTSGKRTVPDHIAPGFDYGEDVYAYLAALAAREPISKMHSAALQDKAKAQASHAHSAAHEDDADADYIDFDERDLMTEHAAHALQEEPDEFDDFDDFDNFQSPDWAAHLKYLKHLTDHGVDSAEAESRALEAHDSLLLEEPVLGAVDKDGFALDGYEPFE